jgi:hypothetical protein
VRKKRKTRRKVGRKSKASDLSSEPSTASGAAAEPISQAIWSPEEIAAFEPPEEICPSAWAEKYRELTRRQSSRPGQWHNANQPTLAGIMDLCARRSVRELWIKKSAQVGVSEAIRNFIAWVAHLNPEPVMLVLPNEKKGREIVRKRIIPLFEDTDVLKRLSTGAKRDKKLESITLNNGFELALAWSGSPAAMASDPFCFVVLDEVDKYESQTKQADPVGEARVRIRTYSDRGGKVILPSTPSTEDGPVAVGYDGCQIKLFYFVPCPHCGGISRSFGIGSAFRNTICRTRNPARPGSLRRKRRGSNAKTPTAPRRIGAGERRKRSSGRSSWSATSGTCCWRLLGHGRRPLETVVQRKRRRRATRRRRDRRLSAGVLRSFGVMVAHRSGLCFVRWKRWPAEGLVQPHGGA